MPMGHQVVLVMPVMMVSLTVTNHGVYVCRRFAFGWVLLLMCLLVFGTKETSMFNLVSCCHAA